MVEFDDDDDDIDDDIDDPVLKAKIDRWVYFLIQCFTLYCF
jgi:hypothetical protein